MIHSEEKLVEVKLQVCAKNLGLDYNSEAFKSLMQEILNEELNKRAEALVRGIYESVPMLELLEVFKYVQAIPVPTVPEAITEIEKPKKCSTKKK